MNEKLSAKMTDSYGNGEVGPSWSRLPSTSSQGDKRSRGRTWGGGGGTCHECRKSNATKGPLYISESCQAQLRGGRKHSYHLGCLTAQYAHMTDSDLCPACSGACVCSGGPNAHACKVSLRPSASNNVKDRPKQNQALKMIGSADSDSRSWPAESEGTPQSPAGTAAGERALAEMQTLRRSLRTAGSYRSYHLPDEDDEVPDLERSDSIVSAVMSTAGDSFSVGSAEALRAAAAAMAPGWSVSAARASYPEGGGGSIPLFCFSRPDGAHEAAVKDGGSAPHATNLFVGSTHPLPTAQRPEGSLDDADLSPALLQMLSEIAPRSVLEMCLADQASEVPGFPKAQLQPEPLFRRPAPPLGPVWASTMPPSFPGPAPVPFAPGLPPTFSLGRVPSWMPSIPSGVPIQTQTFWSF